VADELIPDTVDGLYAELYPFPSPDPELFPPWSQVSREGELSYGPCVPRPAPDPPE
jgi:hypothetical protein